ncbi:hypothetical protein G6652_09625 [Polynucleobacter paneuropaeus]|nr:hypothetical protein [Polynucleobacter paneuropaeus]MBT8617485.1 hypothetical protein [Polynucleobacter paneuropaeus]MBT8619367.1 hypothetical protein [Polynucleobacter paneuropaeus]MBT8621251.1 hypothetical protein [Polynucleobacter paneuropaeus]MBT8626782.1 hypothetical protein [Polynucleobacter paneuropaeus]
MSAHTPTPINKPHLKYETKPKMLLVVTQSMTIPMYPKIFFLREFIGGNSVAATATAVTSISRTGTVGDLKNALTIKSTTPT